MESMDACSRFPSFSDLTWDPLRDGSHVSQLLWCPNATLKREKPGRSGSLRFLGFPSISYAGQMLRSLPSCHCLAIWDLQDLHRSESVDLKLIFKRFTTQHSDFTEDTQMWCERETQGERPAAKWGGPEHTEPLPVELLALEHVLSQLTVIF